MPTPEELARINIDKLLTACGWTEIHIPKSRGKENPKIFCVKRFQELRDAERNKRGSQPGGKPMHLLSDIDPVARTAICSLCGPTEIRKHNINGSIRYSCATKERTYARKYRPAHFSSKSTKPSAHGLSQIDEEKKTAVCSKCGPVTIYIWQGKHQVGRRCSNASVSRIPGALEIRREMNISTLNNFKAQRGCKRCGYNSDLLGLTIYSRIDRKRPIKIEKLLKLNSKELMQKLENCEVFYVDCRS